MSSPSSTWRGPSPDKVAGALDVLGEVHWQTDSTVYVPDLLPVLATILDEESGMPAILGSLLPNTAGLIEGQVLPSWPVEIRHIIAQLRTAAPEVTDCHDLHQAVDRLAQHEAAFDAPLPRSYPLTITAAPAAEPHHHDQSTPSASPRPEAVLDEARRSGHDR
ncbi:hypothetical protein AB0L75_28390 [Streptomyces sp. NPDC052101]|uniref:hypothetical protein n=1 Tax=Streptomyces sp. NPDC052101 TaxID=3155763 RepID=UPI00341F6EC5